MKTKSHLAFYGDVVIPRAYCSECDTYAFVIDGEIKCCGSPYSEALPERVKRMSDMALGRKRPSRAWQDYILKEQHYRCFYCERRFGQIVWRFSKSIALRVNWDHVNPFVYSLDNRDQNFVASCHVCNTLKHDMIFKDADDAKTYISDRWKRKGYTDLRPVRITLHSVTEVAKVL